MKDRGLLFHQEQYLHDYPFCWRADEDPLIQYPRKSWFIRTTQFRDRMLANNSHIHWLPEHIRDGRFGNFLETNVDWALSRERYWGTPLPIWVCEKSGYMEAVALLRGTAGQAGRHGRRGLGSGRKRKNPSCPTICASTSRISTQSLSIRPRRPATDATRAGRDRLLVRFRGDAVCPMGISAQRGLARAVCRSVSRRLHQRGPRPDPRLVL